MRKTLFTGILAAVLSIFMALPAAAITVDFHGKALTGVLSSSNAYLLGGDDSDSAFIGAGKMRFRAEVGTDDGRAKMVYGFETGANNFGGSGWEYSGDSEDFENRFAYIQSTLPGMSDNIFARAGLQKTGVNHWVWTETAAGITANGKGGVNWTAGWFRGLEDGFADDTADNLEESDLFVVKGDFSPASGLTLGGFGIYATDFGNKRDIDQGSDQYWVGTTGEISGKVFASGDLIYQGGETTSGNDDVSAYLANATVGTHINDTSKVSFNALYVSGDDNGVTDGDQEAFQSIDADVKVGQIFFKDSLAASMDRFVDDQFGTTMPAGLRNNGLINFAVEGEMQLDAKNNLRGAVRYLATPEEYEVTGEDDLGYEIDLWYSYKMNQNLTLKLEGAYLFSGDLAETMFDDDDNVYQIGAGAVFAF